MNIIIGIAVGLILGIIIAICYVIYRYKNINLG